MDVPASTSRSRPSNRMSTRRFSLFWDSPPKSPSDCLPSPQDPYLKRVNCKLNACAAPQQSQRQGQPSSGDQRIFIDLPGYRSTTGGPNFRPTKSDVLYDLRVSVLPLFRECEIEPEAAGTFAASAGLAPCNPEMGRPIEPPRAVRYARNADAGARNFLLAQFLHTR